MSAGRTIPFSECEPCLRRPRVTFGDSDRACVDGSVAGAVTLGLVDLLRETTLIEHCFTCPHCHTYYRLERIDIGITRLFRITISEARGIFRCRRDSPAARRAESAWIRANQRHIVRQMKDGLRSAAARAREFAAETMADLFKETKRLDELRQLSRHPDADVRMGVLVSFAERPYHAGSLGCPAGFRLKGYASSKPFVEPERLLAAFALRLCDAEPRVRHFVECMLGNSYIGDDKLVKALRRVPEASRSVELKKLLVPRLWSSQPDDVDELVRYLGDETEEVRRRALWRMYELGRDRHRVDERVLAEFLPRVRERLAAHPSPEMAAYLQDPAGPEPEDDEYD